MKNYQNVCFTHLHKPALFHINNVYYVDKVKPNEADAFGGALLNELSCKTKPYNIYRFLPAKASC